MQNKQYILPVFIICLILVILLFLLGSLGFLNWAKNLTQDIFFPVNGFFYHIATGQQKNQIANLQKENLQLSQKLVDLEQLQQDNTALRDQFQTATIPSQQLLPATVVGQNNAIPNITFPETIIIGVGSADNVTNGLAVVVNNNLIGLITKTSAYFSQVTLISNQASSFSVKTSGTHAIGVIKGQGSGQMILDNVLLSDSLKINDDVVTSGNQNISGQGFPPNLIIGKIIHIQKNPSNLFQSADVVPLIPYDRLTTVFVLLP